MTIARAIIWPGSFGDSSLPKIDLGYTPPLPGALYSWSADTLPLGPIDEWFDAVNGVRIGTDDGAPQVITSGSGRAISFNGTEDRMRCLFPERIAGAHAVIVVYRMPSPTYGDAIISDQQGNTGAGVVVVSSTGTLVGYTDSSYLYPSPSITADSDWHVGILYRDGANSALRIDEAETIGTLSDAIDRRGLAFGYATQGDLRGALEIARVDVIAGTTDAPQRAAIANALAARYNI